MGALSDACLSNQQKTLREICYHTMEFENIDNSEKGHVKCFSEQSIVEELVELLGHTYKIEGLSFIETRLLLDCSEKNRKLKKEKLYNLTKQLLDLYKNDQAMRPLACVPALDQANSDLKKVVVTQAEWNSIDQAVKDICVQEDIRKIKEEVVLQIKEEVRFVEHFMVCNEHL